MSIRPDAPIQLRAHMIARDLRQATQAAGQEWRAERPVYRVEPKHEGQPFFTRTQLCVVGISAAAIIVPWVVGVFTLARWLA